jgi:phosphatidylserine/phosphatidylglycerophosphate/cardiolipin synthase-like enzyme
MRRQLARLRDMVTSGAAWLRLRKHAAPAPAPDKEEGRAAVRLIVQPEDGLKPVLQAIAQARRTLDISIFRRDDKRVTKAVQAAVGRGVTVRALVAHRNSAGAKELRALEEWLLQTGPPCAARTTTFSATTRR